MSDEFYVKLTGNLLQGRSPDVPAQFLSDTFHVPLETGRTYFKGEPTTLKKKLDRETAEKVCQRLRNAGAECDIEAVPELGFTLELIDDAAESPAPAAPSAPAETPEVALDEDDFSLELVDGAPELASLEPERIEQPEEVIAQPIAEDLNELSLDTPAEVAEFDLESVAVDESEPAGMELELNPMTEPLEEPLDPPQEPAAAPAADSPPPPPPKPPSMESGSEDKSESVDIGDVQTDAGGGGGVGGMLPQASTAPSFKRPGAMKTEEPVRTGGLDKKLIMPIAGGVVLLLLAAGAYLFVFSEPEPPPQTVAQKKPVAKVKPVKVDNSMFIALQVDEVKARFDSLSGSIHTWKEQFRDGASQASTPEQVKAALKTDMGVGDEDWQDPWGSAIELKITETGISLISAGPDKKMGTDDDVVKE